MNILFIAHRKELIDQAHAKLLAFGIDAGVIMAKDARTDVSKRVQVASIQTLSRRDALPSADLIFVDEAHHSASNSMRDILAAYPNAKVIGLTATPWRCDDSGLSDIFDAHVVATTPRELMDSGSLVEYDAFAFDAPELHELSKVAGDFHQGELGLACNTTVLVGNIVEEWLKAASGRRTICFAVSRLHSQNIVAEFNAQGVRAEHLDCDTAKLDRERILAGLASGDVTVVSSVGVLTEGFDCPAAAVCILACPTESPGKLLQQIGRVLRPHPKKERALILDHAGNLMRHGFPDDDRDYSPRATPKRIRELHTCPFCCVVFGAIRPDGCCPRCAELIAVPIQPREAAPSARQSEKLVVDGKRIGRETIERMRAERLASGIKGDLTDIGLARAASATTEQKAAEYKRLLAVAAQKGYKPGFASHKYRELFGVWPRFRDGVLEATEAAVRPFSQLEERAA